jgi:hypothetical protein
MKPAIATAVLTIPALLAQPPSQGLRLAPPKLIRLKALSKGEIDKAKASAPSPGPLITGTHRSLPAKSTGVWRKLPDGRAIWLMAIESTGARALRLHFDSFDVGDGKVWIHSRDQVAGPYTGKGPLKDGEFWSDIVSSARVTVEFAPAKGGGSGSPPFRLDKVAHQFAD